MTDVRPPKITFAELREQGTHGIIVFCADYHCSHNIRMTANGWPDDVRLSDIEDRFVCTACGKRGLMSVVILIGIGRVQSPGVTDHPTICSRRAPSQMLREFFPRHRR